MPSGGQTPISEEDADQVYEVARAAIEHGLLYDWLRYYSGGLAAGQRPVNAAYLAAIEWDF